MREIDLAELLLIRKTKQSHTLIDCRGSDYFAWEHIPGAINIRWKRMRDLSSELLPNKSQPIITYCQSFLCNASKLGAEALADLGYSNILEFSGGIEEWKAHGHQTEIDSRTRLAKNVYRFPNQTFYAEAVGSYLIELPDRIILIDGPQAVTEEVLDFLANFAKPIELYLTHDATSLSAHELRTKANAKILLHQADKSGKWLEVKPDGFIQDNHSIAPGLTVMHTPGHTPGSVCILDQANGFLYTGDSICADELGRICPFDDRGENRSSKSAWEDSLKKIQRLEFEAIWPFHGQPLMSQAQDQLKRFLNQGV